MSGLTHEFDVISVGSWTNFDHLLEVTALPAPGDTVQIRSPIDEVERVYFGGCAPNVAVGATQLGARAALVSVVGAMISEHAATQPIWMSVASTSGRCNSSPTNAAGIVSHSAMALGTPSAYHKLVSPRGKKNTRRIRPPSRRQKWPSSPIASTASPYAGRSWRERAASATSDILVCTEHELDQVLTLLGCRETNELLDIGLSAIVCTRGAAGAFWQTAQSRGSSPAVVASRVIDPTGAGDGFVAGLAVGMAQGQSLPAAIRLGASVASFVVEAVGCQTKLPTMAEARARLAEQ